MIWKPESPCVLGREAGVQWQQPLLNCSPPCQLLNEVINLHLRLHLTFSLLPTSDLSKTQHVTLGGSHMQLEFTWKWESFDVTTSPKDHRNLHQLRSHF